MHQEPSSERHGLTYDPHQSPKLALTGSEPRTFRYVDRLSPGYLLSISRLARSILSLMVTAQGGGSRKGLVKGPGRSRCLGEEANPSGRGVAPLTGDRAPGSRSTRVSSASREGF